MEVRNEISLKKSLPLPITLVPEFIPEPTGSKEMVPSASQTDPCKSSPPPTLALLTLPFPCEISPSNSEPPSLRPIDPLLDQTPMDFDDNTNTPTSGPLDPPNQHIQDQLLPNGEIHTKASGICNRRNNVLFRKSKSASPQKPKKNQDVSAVPLPPLGTKTFLSVVIPRLETLLLPKKRTRSNSAHAEEDEETPVKRLGTGSRLKAKHFLIIIIFSLSCSSDSSVFFLLQE